MPRGAIPAALKKRRGKGGKARKPKAKPEPAYDSDASNVDDDDFEGWDGYKPGGYHPVKVGEVYNERYRVLQKLGWGHFSTVWRCADMADGGRIVALKVQKSASHYTEAAADEIAILDFVGDQADGMGQDIPVVRLLDTFTHNGPHGRHTCMVFELLGDNLLRLIKASRYRGVSPQTVRALTRRITRALAFLHSHCGIIHTDVKPENVLLTHSVEDLPALDQFAPRRSASSSAAAAAAGAAESGAAADRAIGSKAAPDGAAAAAAAGDEEGDEDVPEDAEYDPTTARGGAGWASSRRHHSASRSPPRSRRRPEGADSDDDNDDDDGASGRSDEPSKPKVPGVDFPATTDDEPAWIAKELAGTSMSKRLVKATRRRLKQRWARMRLAAAASPQADQADAVAAAKTAADGLPVDDFDQSDLEDIGAAAQAALEGDDQDDEDDDDDDDSVDAALDPVAFQSAAVDLSAPGAAGAPAAAVTAAADGSEEGASHSGAPTAARPSSPMGDGEAPAAAAASSDDASSPSSPSQPDPREESKEASFRRRSADPAALPTDSWFAAAEARAAALKGEQPHGAMPLTPAEAVLLETGELDAVGCIAVRGFAAVLPTTRAEADRGSALAAVRLGRGATFPDAAWVRDAIAEEAERRAGASAANGPSEAGAGARSVQWRSALERVLLACSDVRWRNDGGRGGDDVTARRRLAAARHAWEFRVRQMGAVVVDLGNACWVDKHFTDDVQTRQYRSPEVTLGAGYDTSADVWSLGCMVFEMLTGELLFDPRKGDIDKRTRQPLWSREADHIAQIIELLGPAPRSAALAGKASGDFFTGEGALRSIPSLRFWGPAAVLHCKYRLPLAEARLAESFLVETLAFDPQQRTPAQEILQHPFIACSLSAPQLAAKSPEDWGWLTQRLLPDGKPSPAALAELEPVEHPSAFATRSDVALPGDTMHAAGSEDGASSSSRGDLTGDPDADALAELVAEFGSFAAAREAVVSMHGDEAGAALDAAAAGEAGQGLRSATEAADAQLGLVQPLGEAAVARLMAGERAEDITTEALWVTAPPSLSAAEAVAAKNFTRLALRSLTGDADAARRIKAALEAGGPVGAVATEGVAIAREYVTLCLSRAADAEAGADADDIGDDGGDGGATSDCEDAAGSDEAPDGASGDDESL
ncbi:hypothetical protein FNF27_04072 [Cafeteria roenbergensis]|uniref:non-specific serine/threonine protein kinase n=1 Tax=Cafeteria roenbergensis TaxID=33653 RepID=A0A5A8E9Q6_CAFRO|nr:hypothetical protein FNF27_04072 [Cafeteria roenbergensis]